jgi:hypothetical protein
MLDVPRCEALVDKSREGDGVAWRALVEHLWPFWEVVVRSSRAMGPLGRNDDHVRDVMTALVDKLGPSHGAALGLYPAWRRANPDKTFEDWIRIVTSYAIRDHVRTTLGRRRERDPDVPSPKRLLNEFVTTPAGEATFGSSRPAFTAAQTARELLEWAESKLARDQHHALLLWMEGAEFEEIGEELCAGDEAAARKLVRAAVAVLRRRFVEVAT